MGDGGGDLSSTNPGEVGKRCVAHLSANISKRVAVEEKKWRAAMAMPQEVYCFGEGDGALALLFPLACNRFVSLSITAVLRSTSFARSSIVMGDKLPTPVFEKLGSGLKR